MTDLSAKKIAGAQKTREKGEATARAVENAEADFARRPADAGVSAEVRILGAAASEKSGRYFLEKFLRTEKGITTREGDPVERSSSSKHKAGEILRAWSSHIRSVEPRNAFHVIFSARSGTGLEAMTRAVRDFLSEQAGGASLDHRASPGDGPCACPCDDLGSRRRRQGVAADQAGALRMARAVRGQGTRAWHRHGRHSASRCRGHAALQSGAGRRL